MSCTHDTASSRVIVVRTFCTSIVRESSMQIQTIVEYENEGNSLDAVDYTDCKAADAS